MPLIVSSEYRRLGGIGVFQGATIAAGACDPHDALLQVVAAVNHTSPEVRWADDLASHTAHGLTLGWLGNSVSVYADDDPFWDELIKRNKDDNLFRFIERRAGRLPIAIHAEVSNGLKLTFFLAAFRAYLEQTAPGMTVWESRSYRGQPYVKVSPSESAREQHMAPEDANLAIYYAASADALVATPNEKVLKRAIDRRFARTKASAESKESAAKAKPWLGSNVAMHVDRKALDVLERHLPRRV